MSTEHLFLAIYLGDPTGSRMKAWEALPEVERQAKMQAGMAAWHQWGEQHQASIVDMGGPLGKTKAINESGIADISNNLTGYSIVRAASFEDAARMFEHHPHYTIFPGKSVELMPILPIPGM